MRILQSLSILFLCAVYPLSCALATPYPALQKGTIDGLTYTFQSDVYDYRYGNAYGDAYGGNLFEIYRIGYAFDDKYLYFTMQTGMAQEGRGAIDAGDLYINVGGSHLKGYDDDNGEGKGLDATYSSGNVFGLALTTHSGDMNADFVPAGVSSPSSADNGYDWGPVEQGHLYSDAIFSTGSEEKYEETDAGKRAFGDDGGDDPFGGRNNLPVHIAEYEEDLTLSGAADKSDVTWDALPVNPWGAGYDLFDVNAAISLEALGLAHGGLFEFWWSMECGNDGVMIAGEIPGSPDPDPEEPYVYYPELDPPSGQRSTTLSESSTGQRSIMLSQGSAFHSRSPAAPVPEPATMVLFGTGLLCLFGIRRKFTPGN